MKNLYFLKQPTNMYPRTLVKSFITGAEIGIPLNIFSNVYTQMHYGYDIITIKPIILQFLLSYYAYGYDRLKDADEYESDPNLYNNLSQKKLELYNNIINNKKIYELSFFVTEISILSLLLLNDNYITILPFIPLLLTSRYYKEFKQNLSFYKPLYISFMWTMSSVILPCVLYDNNYSILLSPQDYLPCLLLLFATSNYADIKDIKEDTLNNIETIPVKFGIDKSNFISLIALAISSILFVESSNFVNRPIINSLVEIQNFGLMYLLYNSSFID